MTDRAVFELGLLGHPVAHSLSAVMHEAALRELGLQGRYVLVDVEEAALDTAVDRVRRGEVQGYNVTVPHKQAVAARCDRLAGAAAVLGAVNTLVRTPAGQVEGHNTDLPGLVSALDEAWPGRPWTGGGAVVIGAGGAARAAVLAALDVGCVRVRILNRTVARAQRVARELATPALGELVAGGLEDGCAGAQLVLQATSVGLGQLEPSESTLGIIGAALQGVDAATHLMDLVYRPTHTAWMSAADARGAQVHGGLGMLIHQAARAFELWTGREAPVATMRAAAVEAVARAS